MSDRTQKIKEFQWQVGARNGRIVYEERVPPML
jgi:hypothetical protein